jgi:PE family
LGIVFILGRYELGRKLRSAHAAATVPTSNVLAAAGDEVSAAIASLFGAHGQAYQALSAEAAAFHEQFVALMNAGWRSTPAPRLPMPTRCRPSSRTSSE